MWGAFTMCAFEREFRFPLLFNPIRAMTLVVHYTGSPRTLALDYSLHQHTNPWPMHHSFPPFIPFPPHRYTPARMCISGKLVSIANKESVPPSN